MTYAEIQAAAAAAGATVAKAGKGYSLTHPNGEIVTVKTVAELEAAFTAAMTEANPPKEDEAPKEDPAAELSRLKAELLAAQAQIQVLSTTKRAGRPAKPQTPEEIAEAKRKAEWEVIPAAEAGTFLAEIQGLDRIEQCNVLAKVARKLPWRMVPEMVKVVFEQALNQLHGEMPADATPEALEVRTEQHAALWAEVTTRKTRNTGKATEATDEAAPAETAETNEGEPKEGSEANGETAPAVEPAAVA